MRPCLSQNGSDQRHFTAARGTPPILGLVINPLVWLLFPFPIHSLPFIICLSLSFSHLFASDDGSYDSLKILAFNVVIHSNLHKQNRLFFDKLNYFKKSTKGAQSGFYIIKLIEMASKTIETTFNHSRLKKLFRYHMR